ncbi:MAG: 2-oxo acid dehydrogenase subunit E2, partial [Pseudomonadota bacterium]
MSVIASPSVRKLAADRGIKIEELARSLGRQTIAREDVLGETDQAPAVSTRGKRYWDVDHAQWGPVRTEKMSRIATVAAENLSAAQSLIPAVTHHDRADMTRIEATRAALKAEGVRITGLAFHVAVLARCLREFPRFNASLSADGASLIL